MRGKQVRLSIFPVSVTIGLIEPRWPVTRIARWRQPPDPKPCVRVDYPTSDGKPMAETELHWQVMVDVVEPMRDYFAADPMVHVGGNLLLFYEEGNPRKHVSPDVFMVRGIPKFPLRDYYLLWEEGKPPDVVIEITSKTTEGKIRPRSACSTVTFSKIPEYFQFDPTEDYLEPSLQGVRRVGDDYEPIVCCERPACRAKSSGCTWSGRDKS